MFIFLHSVVVAFFVTFISAEEIDTRMIAHEPSLDTVVSTEYLLFQADVSHHLECAATCMRYAGCVAFSTTPMDPTSKLTCRGHYSKVFSQSSMVAASGSKTYYVERNPKASTWLERTCSVNSDCPSTVPNVVCYAKAGQCLCQPGYYYSHGGDTCVAECALPDLQPTFLRYPKLRIPDHNIAKVYGCLMPEAGRKACLNEMMCRTFDERFKDGKCYLQDVTAISPGVEPDITSRRDHYQRTCL